MRQPELLVGRNSGSIYRGCDRIQMTPLESAAPMG